MQALKTTQILIRTTNKEKKAYVKRAKMRKLSLSELLRKSLRRIVNYN